MAKINFFACAPAILLIALMVMCSLPIIGTSDAKSVSKFDGNISSKVIDFKTKGDDASLSFTLPRDVPVTSTYLNVSTADLGTNNFCQQPGVDFGVDGNWEWQFQGTGYGQFGKQTLLSDNNTRLTHIFTGAGSQTNGKIRVPKDATVSSASMDLNGRLNANTPTKRTISASSYDSGLAVGDLNGDGNPDIATVYQAYSSSIVYWYKSSGGSVPTYTRYTLDTGIMYAMDCDIGDINGDGYLDIVIAAGYYYTGYASVIWYKNSGGASPTFTRYVVDSTIAANDVKIADLDNDGYKDLVAVSYYNGAFWFKSSGGASPTFTKKTIEALSYPYLEQCDVGDVDKDGDIDIVTIAYWGGGVQVYVNKNNAASFTKVAVETLSYGFDVAFADIDRDGDLDIVASSTYGYVLKWYSNIDKTSDKGSGDGSTWKGYVIDSSFYYAHGFDVYDIANDGYMDVVCTGYYGNTFYWFEAPDDPTTEAWTKFSVDSLYYGYDCVIRDMNGDSKPDVVATAQYGGGLYWYDLQYSYPTNPSMQLGGTGSIDWSLSGTCKGVYRTGNVTSKLQSLINAGSPVSDIYGNKYIDIPVKVSLGSGGRLTLQGIDIRYNLTVAVTTNSHNTNLKNDINDLVPDYGTGNQKININVHSNSPGAIRISGLYIEYNAFPILDSNILNYHVNEDSVTENLFDVRDHFSDDYDLADDLSYEVHMSTADQSNVRVTLVNNYFLKVQTQKKDWNGVVSVIISATDRGELGQGITGKRTISSNSFSIIVDPVNDPPTTSTAILQNVIMNEGQSYATVSLDGGPYFTDLESDKLYYACAVDPASAYTGEDLDAYIDGYNRVVLKANGNFYGSKVPVRVYCNDRNDLSDTSALPFTDFTASVTQLMDDGPKWGTIETIVMEEDTDLPQAVKLTDFLQAGDTAVSKLTLMILFNVNGSSIFADIDNQGYMNLYASETNYDGTTNIAIRATDGYNFADTMLNVAVNPANDAPTARINEPLDGAKVTVGDRIRITGSAFDPEAIQKVEIAVGNQETWNAASGTNSWGYNWEVDPTAYTIGSSVTVNVRVYDGQAYSEIYTTNVTIIEGGAGPTSDDRDGDGAPNDKDAFPDNPYETKDTDKDGWGDNSDAFPTDPKKHTNTPDVVEPGTNDGTGPAKDEEGSASWFNLWWVVLVLVALEIALLVFFAIKKVTSKKGPSTKKKLKKKAESK